MPLKRVTKRMRRHWKISARDTFCKVLQPICTEVTKGTLIKMEDKSDPKTREKIKKMFSWSDGLTPWVARLKFVCTCFHFYFAFVYRRNQPRLHSVLNSPAIILVTVTIMQIIFDIATTNNVQSNILEFLILKNCHRWKFTGVYNTI